MPDDEEVVLAFRRFGISGDFVILVRIHKRCPAACQYLMGITLMGRHKLSCPLVTEHVMQGYGGFYHSQVGTYVSSVELNLFNNTWRISPPNPFISLTDNFFTSAGGITFSIYMIYSIIAFK